jgi:hypothetical protein
VKITIPNSQSINRGNLRIDELVDACRKADFTDVIMVRIVHIVLLSHTNIWVKDVISFANTECVKWTETRARYTAFFAKFV